MPGAPCPGGTGPRIPAWPGKKELFRNHAKTPFVEHNNICRYPEEGKFKRSKGTQEVASFSKVWTTTLKNFDYNGSFYNKGIIFLRSRTNIEVLKTTY